MFQHYVHFLYLSSPQFFQDLVNIPSVNQYICQLDDAHKQVYIVMFTYQFIPMHMAKDEPI